MPRLLLLLPQLPQDPASGAARATLTLAQLLARSGWDVRCLAVTMTETTGESSPLELLQAAGHSVAVRRPNRAVFRHDRPVLELVDAAGVVHQLLDTGTARGAGWRESQGSQFNRLFARELATHPPEIVLSFATHEHDVDRLRRVQRSGAKVVFALHNLSYQSAGWLHDWDDVLVPSDFLASCYRHSLGLKTTVLPSPFDLSEVITPEREPIFFAAINPQPSKGAFFLARLAEEVGIRRPDLPMLFVESRGSVVGLVEAGMVGGFDLRRHSNLMFAPSVTRSADLFPAMRVLLAPSVVEESFGRVVAEALLNGVPPLVSDRGALAEAANGGGFVLPLPPSLTMQSCTPVSTEDVLPWLEVMEKLADDPAAYAEAGERARNAGASYHPEILVPRYVAYFEGMLSKPGNHGLPPAAR